MKKIPLTQGREAIVDDDDFERVNQFRWHFVGCGRGYASRSQWIGGEKKYHNELMHRFILGLSKRGNGAAEVDHINHDGLDNRKENLRVVTHAQNCRNRSKSKNKSSQYKGVTWNSQGKNWRATITANGKYIHLGPTRLEVVAARVYDHWAKKLHGEFASTNFL